MSIMNMLNAWNCFKQARLLSLEGRHESSFIFLTSAVNGGLDLRKVPQGDVSFIEKKYMEFVSGIYKEVKRTPEFGRFLMDQIGLIDQYENFSGREIITPELNQFRNDRYCGK